MSQHAGMIHLSSQFVLALGNRLNASTFRGSATGFQLEGLVKVMFFVSHLCIGSSLTNPIVVKGNEDCTTEVRLPDFAALLMQSSTTL